MYRLAATVIAVAHGLVYLSGSVNAEAAVFRADELPSVDAPPHDCLIGFASPSDCDVEPRVYKVRCGCESTAAMLR